jgi:hypothetical protein
MRPTTQPRVFARALLTACLAAGCHQPILPREPAPPPLPGAVTQEVLLRIDSPLAGTVLAKAGEGGGVVCEAPCLRSVTIEEGAHYELHAPDHLPTVPFKLHSPEDPQVWLVHEPTTPGTLWALRTATVASAGVGTALFATANVLGASAKAGDEVPLALGVSGLAIGLGVMGIFAGFTAAYSDSDYELRDPALPGFRW